MEFSRQEYWSGLPFDFLRLYVNKSLTPTQVTTYYDFFFDENFQLYQEVEFIVSIHILASWIL